MGTQASEDVFVNEHLTFEKVWAMFKESDRRAEEARKEYDRKAEEARKEREATIKENDRKYEEARKESDRKYEEMRKETDRRLGELGNRFGELAEHLVAPGIKRKFNELGFHFDQCSRDCEIGESGNPNVATEIDIFLQNGDIAIAVEVKSKPKESDVDRHVQRMETLRYLADRRGDKRRYQGAIAGAIMNDSVRNYALRTGFYIIEQTGDTVQINIPEGFTPREW